MVESLSTSDDDLLKHAMSGDCEALTLLLEHYGASVRRNVARKIPSRWRALLSDDDVMQQTYADAFRGIGQFLPEGNGSFARWLATLARCNLSDAVKMLEAEKRGGLRRRIQTDNSDASFVGLFEQLAGPGSSPSQHAAKQEARSALKQAIDSLPATYRQVVEMYDLEGRPIGEVVKALARTPGAVYMLRARALDRLRERLGDTSRFCSR